LAICHRSGFGAKKVIEKERTLEGKNAKILFSDKNELNI
jgi:hypothetical protein